MIRRGRIKFLKNVDEFLSIRVVVNRRKSGTKIIQFRGNVQMLLYVDAFELGVLKCANKY